MNRMGQKKTDRVLAGEIKIDDRRLEGAVAKGLRAEGFDVEIVPEFLPGSEDRPPMPGGSTIKIYRKVDRQCTN